MKWYPQTTGKLIPFSTSGPEHDAAWKVLDELRDVIGSDNWYAWMKNVRPHMPNGTIADWTWYQVELAASRKLALVTPPEECNCNGVDYCTHQVTVNDGPYPF